MEGGLLLGHVLLHGGFIVGGGFPLHKGDGPGGTGGQAVAQTIAVVIAQQAGLALHHADGALVAGSGADAAAGAFFLIYLDNSTDHRTTSLRCWDHYTANKAKRKDFLVKRAKKEYNITL